MLPKPPGERGWQLRVEKETHGSRTDQHGVIQVARGVGNARANVLRLQVGKICQNFLLGCAPGKHIENVLNSNTHPADTRASSALAGINRDPLKFVHDQNLTSLGGREKGDYVWTLILKFLAACPLNAFVFRTTLE